MSKDQHTQTDHERDMERLATRLVQQNQRDALLAATDPRNGGGKQDGRR